MHVKSTFPFCFFEQLGTQQIQAVQPTLRASEPINLRRTLLFWCRVYLKAEKESNFRNLFLRLVFGISRPLLSAALAGLFFVNKLNNRVWCLQAYEMSKYTVLHYQKLIHSCMLLVVSSIHFDSFDFPFRNIDKIFQRAFGNKTLNRALSKTLTHQ